MYCIMVDYLTVSENYSNERGFVRKSSVSNHSQTAENGIVGLLYSKINKYIGSYQVV